MPAEIRSLLNGPAGPPPPPPPLPPAIDKTSLRRLSEAISALEEARLNALIELLIAAPASGVSERDATLNLDLEALPVRVFRKVWHFVYDPVSASRPAPDPTESSQESKRNVVVADVLDGPDSPFEAPQWHRSPPVTSGQPSLPRELHTYEPSPYARRRSTYTPVDEDDELKDDPDASNADLPPVASGSSPYVPTKRKASSSRTGKQKRRASSAPSRSDASGNSQREYEFVPPAPHTGPESGSGSGSVSTPAGPVGGKVQWVGPRTGIACTYRSPIPDFPECARTFSRIADMRRHIDHQHCEEEAQAVIDGRLAQDKATLLGVDWKGKISKPTCEGCGQTFSRKDAVKRHQAETGAKFVDGVCTSCPGSGNGSGTGKKRARRK